MEATQALETQMILMLADENHLIRAEAARALSGCDSARSRDALRQALLDRSVVVQKSAEQSLHLLDRREWP
ncbi:hypothetical protein, partial [Bradyrhizobium cosmicum]|uniref:hypothetical protein n=1 Tax=Bradyrhizobium cosmicum TaxID=1404864 RepID=UPI0028E5A595